MRAPGFVRSFRSTLAKEFLVEWRSRSRVSASLFFGVLILLLFSFASGPQPALLERNAPGYLWLAILLSSVLLLTESMRQEQENDAMSGLRLLGVDARALYLAKALGNVLLLWGMAALLLPFSVVLYGAGPVGSWLHVAGVMFLGCGAIAAPGTLYAAMASKVRGRDVLLPLLLFPVQIPGLLAAVKSTTLLWGPDPMQQLPDWMGLLLGFNVVFWIVCALLFEAVIEE